jgi:phage shock protein PspC (stress-responsive transcriptional regulator)
VSAPQDPPPTDAPPLAAFAWRHRLVRPVQGRTFAGVCGALARATNTDPVLWRVILVVLTFFGGIGLLAYLLGWLLLPADGDTAAPVEALGGRGWSRTSRGKTIFGLVVAALIFAGYVSKPWRATPLLAILVLGGVLLLLLRDQGRFRAPAGTRPTPPPGAPGAGGPAPYTPPPAYAPYGPFVATPPRPVPVWTPPPPRPPRPHSRLGLVILSLATLVLGGLVVTDLLGYAVTPLAYFGAPLAVIALGLLIGTWFGRARWLIPFGIVLTLALSGGYAAAHTGGWTHWKAGTAEWTPTSVSDIQDRYTQDFGDGKLDLSDVDFNGANVDVTVVVNAGTLEITLPPNVDATVVAKIDAGNADVLGQNWSGLGQDTRTVTDLGGDGVGGGRLHVTATVHAGTLEVHR